MVNRKHLCGFDIFLTLIALIMAVASSAVLTYVFVTYLGNCDLTKTTKMDITQRSNDR